MWCSWTYATNTSLKCLHSGIKLKRCLLAHSWVKKSEVCLLNRSMSLSAFTLSSSWEPERVRKSGMVSANLFRAEWTVDSNWLCMLSLISHMWWLPRIWCMTQLHGSTCKTKSSPCSHQRTLPSKTLILKIFACSSHLSRLQVRWLQIYRIWFLRKWVTILLSWTLMSLPSCLLQSVGMLQVMMPPVNNLLSSKTSKRKSLRTLRTNLSTSKWQICSSGTFRSLPKKSRVKPSGRSLKTSLLKARIDLRSKTSSTWLGVSQRLNLKTRDSGRSSRKSSPRNLGRSPRRSKFIIPYIVYSAPQVLASLCFALKDK